MDICQLILEDHAELRRLFAQIDEIAPTETDALAAVWGRLKHLLDAHAENEERHFYPRVVQEGEGAGDADDMEDEVEDAIEDHNKIRDAVQAVDAETVGSKAWFAAVAKANEENGDHLAEEERQALTDARAHLSLEERHALGVQFAAFSAAHLEGVTPVNKDPAKYIEEHAA